MPFLQGEKIYLRPLEFSDVTPEYVEWLNDRELGRYMEYWKFPHSSQEIFEYIKGKQAEKSEVFFAICMNDAKLSRDCYGSNIDTDHLGNIKLGPIDWVHRRAEIGLFVTEPKKGYGTEAIGLVCDYAFKVLGLHKVKAGMYEENVPSFKAFSNNGFLSEAKLKDEVFHDGKWQDLILVGKINDS